MELKIIHAEDAIISQWSGGVTSQLYIYPENSDYKARSFKFRLSRAVAYDELSTYTKLPGVTRYLVSLENTAIVKHAGTKPVILEPFGNIDCFSGDVETTAEGAIVDFNLMLANGASGKMELMSGGSIDINGEYTHFAVYASSNTEIRVNSEVCCLKNGDLAVLALNGEHIRAEVRCEGSPAIVCLINEN